MDDRQKAAFDFARDTSKQFTTLATAIISLSIVFKNDFIGSASEMSMRIAVGSWGILFLSVVAGLVTLMALTGSLEPIKGNATEPSINGKNVRIPMFIQVFSFLLGLLGILIFGAVTMWEGLPVVPPTP